jgi:translation initiation factor 1
MSLVYSTERGRMCPDCRQAIAECRCTTGAEATVPDRIVARLRIEKQGRGGKTVTVIDGLPNNPTFLKALCQDLKKACGTGGAVGDGAVEVQGDQRDRIRERLRARGLTVKG